MLCHTGKDDSDWVSAAVTFKFTVTATRNTSACPHVYIWRQPIQVQKKSYEIQYYKRRSFGIAGCGQAGPAPATPEIKNKNNCFFRFKLCRRRRLAENLHSQLMFPPGTCHKLAQSNSKSTKKSAAEQGGSGCGAEDAAAAEDTLLGPRVRLWHQHQHPQARSTAAEVSKLQKMVAELESRLSEMEAKVTDNLRTSIMLSKEILPLLQSFTFYGIAIRDRRQLGRNRIPQAAT